MSESGSGSAPAQSSAPMWKFWRWPYRKWWEWYGHFDTASGLVARLASLGVVSFGAPAVIAPYFTPLTPVQAGLLGFVVIETALLLVFAWNKRWPLFAAGTVLVVLPLLFGVSWQWSAELANLPPVLQRGRICEGDSAMLCFQINPLGAERFRGKKQIAVLCAVTDGVRDFGDPDVPKQRTQWHAPDGNSRELSIAPGGAFAEALAERSRTIECRAMSAALGTVKDGDRVDFWDGLSFGIPRLLPRRD